MENAALAGRVKNLSFSKKCESSKVIHFSSFAFCKSDSLKKYLYYEAILESQKQNKSTEAMCLEHVSV